ncbi:MAG: NAD-dependent epimerase/dehydratase family protein [Propionibacteriaceae bacterium]|jgi:nucleoside-diphosphate-sugar epimerase|nr:NAD-dependent epimerase/dehydratase family protein [Propionibacteriaceae bacterium]
MARAVIIGGTGKVGSYLVPSLVRAGHTVTVVTRGTTQPAVAADEWGDVRAVTLDRADPGFEVAVRDLGPEIVVDMICFTDADLRRLIGALDGHVGHFLVTGSVWMHGPAGVVPYAEDECRRPFGEYGIQKDLMDRTIAAAWHDRGFPGTAVHPGHIVCPGDIPVGPQGCKSLDSFRTLRAGEPLWLPNGGMECLHHVHAADVAGVFQAAISAGEPAFGEGFHAVAPRAVTLRGYAEEVAGWYGRTADLRFEPFDAFKARIGPKLAAQTLDHIAHSPNASMAKAEAVLGFVPRHTTYQAIRECLASFGL